MYLNVKVQNLTKIIFCAGLAKRQKRRPGDKFIQQKTSSFLERKPGGFLKIVETIYQKLHSINDNIFIQ